jgi:hypothetical protein
MGSIPSIGAQMSTQAQQSATTGAQIGPCVAMRAQKAAAALDVSLSTFLSWVRDGKMPKPVKIGGVALYDFQAVRNAWEALMDGASEDERNPFDE